MKKPLVIVFLVLLISSHVQAKVKSKDINFAKAFYEDSIHSCSAIGSKTFSSQQTINQVEGLIGYDWHADHSANSNSLNVWHQAITDPIKTLMSATHNAIGNENQDNIKIAKNLLVELAEANTLYDSIGYYEVRKKPGCYAGSGDINAPCWYHEYEFASGVFSNYMITALWLKDELNEQEFKVINKYIKKMYKKFLKPIEFQKKEQGLYQMANGGLSILVYASWTNNKKLAAKEINHRFKEMQRLFYKDGYINNNSFRGVRAQWYHSYGLNIALGYVYIANLWGAEVPDTLFNKLVKASELVNLAITDYETFRSRSFNEKNTNITEDPKLARKYTHEMAIALDVLMKIVTGVELEQDSEYLERRKQYFVDDLIGFNPNCIHEELAKQEVKRIEELAKQEVKRIEELAKQEAKRIEANLVLPIFDDLYYQLEGQTLKINIGDMADPKLKPLKQHRDSLQKKCGSSLIDQSGWLSFNSKESRDIKSDRIHHCYYNYFKDSNDKQAFDLYKDILSGANSIFDYLKNNAEL